MSQRCAILVSGYGSGATSGRNLGSPGYSYDFVVKLFEPLFRQCGEFQLVDAPESELGERIAAARRNGLEPLFLCFRGLHDVVAAEGAPTIVVPAWEFPDVPDHAFDGNWRNDWVRVANESARVIVHGEFTREAFARCGVRSPISVVPVPTPTEYFGVAEWEPQEQVRIERPAIVLGGNSPTASVRIDSAADRALAAAPASPRRDLRALIRSLLRQAYTRIARPLLPHWLDRGLTEGGSTALRELFSNGIIENDTASAIDLSGVVYTSIFNPRDGRKNWDDLLTAFLIGLRDRSDATLVLKLIGRDRRRANEILARYRGLNLSHRCRLVIVTDYLSDDEMLELTRGSTYYVTSTRAEGNCLPLMNYLAAGRPSISPSHTAIGDYFSNRMGFVVESHAEPCAWPHDTRLRSRTTWHRLVWPSLVEAFRESYRVARFDRARMRAMAAAAREMSWDRHHPTRVLPHLAAALAQTVPAPAFEPRRAAA
ncbi:MAG: glycosyltransferase [Planctomycetia bacterium]|nr:glycosyltransferase [Planctomycetia bacterium]